MSLDFFLRQNKTEKLNILSFPTHESHNTLLAKTGHNLYLWRGPHIKDWETKYRPLPSNVYLLKPNGPLPPISFDLVLSQNKAGQYPVAQQIAQQLQIPLICLEHCLPMPNWTVAHVLEQKKLCGHANVFISEYSREKWGWGEDAIVIRHGMDTETFNDMGLERESKLLSVVNDWINRGAILGYDVWKNATSTLPTEVWGDSPGLSKPAPSVEFLVERYNKCLAFVSTSIVSPIPMSLLEAAACGCCPIVLPTCMIPEIFTHGKDAYFAKSPQDLRYYCEHALKFPDKTIEMGKQARQTILEKCSLTKFIDSWNEVFSKTVRNFR